MSNINSIEYVDVEITVNEEKIGETVPLHPLYDVAEKAGESSEVIAYKLAASNLAVYSIGEELFVSIDDLTSLYEEIEVPHVN